MTTLKLLSQAVSAGNSRDAKALTQRALDEGVGAGDIVNRALVPAMASVGERFRRNLIFVPELLISGRAMKQALALLEPCFVAESIIPKCTAIIGTVQGDLHDIGKNLVAIMWKGAAFNVVDLGTDVAPAKFVAAIQRHQPGLVGLSAVLTTTMPAMVDTVKAIRASDCASVTIMVGGAPVTQQFADEIGADGYAPDAGAAVDKALALVGAGRQRARQSPGARIQHQSAKH